MKKRLKIIGKCALFLCILGICVNLAYQIMVPKYFYEEDWATSAAFTGFYEMEKNTIDVLFMGSSYAASAFIPQKLYNDYGITGYNLGCEQQNLITTYYWLREALRYQQPKAVVLECRFLFEVGGDKLYNISETHTRKAFDYMRWSPVKLEAVKTICEADGRQSLSGYFFPNVRYHERWKELSKSDFLFWDLKKHCELKGFTPLAAYGEWEGYEPFTVGTTSEETDMMPLMREYFEKLTALCEQEGICLILTDIPSMAGSEEKYNTVQKYADEHGLAYYNFNEKGLYEEINYSLPTDSYDAGHANLWGAEKLTDYIGAALKEQCRIAGRADGQWESTKGYFEGVRKDCELTHITDIDEYLEKLRDDRYTVFFAVKGDGGHYLKDTTVEKMRALGLNANIQGLHGSSYLAILSEGNIEEQTGYETGLHLEGSIKGGLIPYEITSAGDAYGSECSIMIEGQEKAQRKWGLNIVVYRNDTMKVIDSVCFEISEEQDKVTR